MAQIAAFSAYLAMAQIAAFAANYAQQLTSVLLPWFCAAPV
jgi:hypothetical protein